MQDLRDNGVTMLTLGQYLQPSRHHLPVARYVPPTELMNSKPTKWALNMRLRGYLFVLLITPFDKLQWRIRQII